MPGSGGVELRLPVEVTAFACGARELTAVEGMDFDEQQMRDLSAASTLTLMRVSSDDDLWRIAKENRSTVDAITEANGLDALSGPWNRLLLIPKTLS